MTIGLRNSARGLGDAVCAAYVAAGIKKDSPSDRVILYTHHPEWLQDIEGVEIIRHTVICEVNGNSVDLNKGYNLQLKKMVNRKDWYANQIPFELSPVRPSLKRYHKPLREEYVVLSPFSHWHTRDWPIEKWIVLEERLNRIYGIKTFVIGTSADKDGKHFDYSVFKSKTLVDHPPSDIINLILGSRCVVGNDSGIPHLSGMYGVPTVAVTAQIHPDRLFSHTSVKGIFPSDFDCSDCGFGHRKFMHKACSMNCAALSSVSSFHVEKVILDTIRTSNAIILSDVKIKERKVHSTEG